MAEAQKRYGPLAFSLEILEEIQKKETQTERDFADEIDVLLKLWTEKIQEDGLSKLQKFMWKNCWMAQREALDQRVRREG